MSAIDKLKCGGKVHKSKKYKDGGLVPEIPEEIANMLTSILADKKANLLSTANSRENPSEVLKKANALDTGSALLSGAGKGASLGTMIAPGIGTAIGAGVGALASGIGRLVGAGDRKEELAKATKSWSDNYSSQTAGALRTGGYKKGGEIKGPGSGKSDSVNMKAEDGSFIVPEENAEYAKELGMTYLGWKNEESAPKKTGDVNIKASNGEVIFNAREAAILRYHGIDLDSLAPNADESKKDNKMANGGRAKKRSDDFAEGQTIAYGMSDLKYTPPTSEEAAFIPIGLKTMFPDIKDNSTTNQPENIAKPKDKTSSEDLYDWSYDGKNRLVISKAGGVAYDKSGNEYKVNTETNQFEQTGSKSPYGSAVYGEYSDDESVMDLLPELLGAVQTVGGAAGLMAAGRAPDMQVSDTLKKLSGEVRRLSEFGYEPAVLNALNAEIDKTRSDMSRLISEGGSSSGLERMAQLQNVLSTTIDKKAGLAFADAAEKARKFADVIRVDTMKAGQEFDINKMNVEDWYRNQEVFANLAVAGISNIVGARQLKAEQDALKKIGSTNPTFGK